MRADPAVLLVIAHTRPARQTLRNVSRAHDDSVVGSFGRAVLFEPTAFSAFQAVRLREKHGEAIQVERTRPFNEFVSVSEDVREAARRYESREHPAVPYDRFAKGTELPGSDEMKATELDPNETAGAESAVEIE